MADIHANLEAFTAVLGDIERQGGFDELLCLGDIVGYGPDPHACLELLRRQKCLCVAGNHDWAAISKLDTSEFNPDAAAAARWTANQLTAEDRQYLESLPLVAEKGEFTLVHGSPREPIREYVQSPDIACDNLAFLKTPYCLVGHTHAPLIFTDEGGSCTVRGFTPETKLPLGKKRLIINCGGVGQPRDGDSRASYGIYDSQGKSVRLYRVAYDIAATQAKMLREGLPISLATRLSYGV